MTLLLIIIKMYKVNILKQDYSIIQLIHKNTKEQIQYNGFSRGLFHNDEVNINNDGSLQIQFTSLPPYLVGELELYSSCILKSNTSTPLYIFKPFDQHYPKFYVHSNCRSKYLRNILISVHEFGWNLSNTYPHAKILNVFGIYDEIPVIEQALCYHYNLLDSNYRLKNIPVVKYGYDISRTTINNDIFSIDPDGCLDIDDAFSIKEDNESFHLWIHIADVYSNLMAYFDDAPYIISHLHQASSIYLRTQIKHMLSTLWSTNICSLLEGNNKNMLTLYIKLDINNNITCNFFPSNGKITKNYNYDNSTKLFKQYFHKISLIFNIFMNKYGYENTNIKIISNTHQFIESLMIIYNLYFGNEIMQNWPYKLLRVQNTNKYTPPTNCDTTLYKFLSIISNNSAYYTISNDLTKHQSLNIYNYTHTTSPIRRKVDLINQMLYYNNEAIKYNIMLGIIDDINLFEKKLKKMNRDLNKIYLLERVYNSPNYETNCYIYGFNITKRRIDIFFPKEKLSFKYNIVINDLYDIYDVTFNDNRIYIINKQTNSIEKILQIMTLITVKINGIPSIYNLDSALLIDFS
jgi:exoribonuclease R